MSETMTPADAAPEGPITLDDIRHKALRIRDEVKDEVSEQVADRRNQLIAVGAVALVVVIGIAYFFGTRAGRRAAEPPLY
jgi:hypothetical protein